MASRAVISYTHAGNEQPARHVVRNAGTEIVCHALDLEQPPATLIAEDLAREIMPVST